MDDIRGMKFPLEINPANGRFVMSEGIQNIKESIYVIVMTQKSERFTRPEFGSTIQSWTFTEPSVTELRMMERSLAQAVLSQEPRVQAAQARIQREKDSDRMEVYLQYTVKGGEKDDVRFLI